MLASHVSRMRSVPVLYRAAPSVAAPRCYVPATDFEKHTEGVPSGIKTSAFFMGKTKV
jgi:hypothetical protein